MVSRCIPLILVAVVLVTGVAVSQDQPADAVTRQLFEQYVARTGKINTESVIAAMHLVAERGRPTGFWKEVVAELNRNNEQSEIGCVRVLGKMLAIDAAARDTIRRQEETGEVSAWAATVCLSPDVVTEIVVRAAKADRNRIDHYVIALTRARVPEARDFFQSILNATRGGSSESPVAAVLEVGPSLPKAKSDGEKSELAPTGIHHTDSTRFHAAVGLAQLGDQEGLDWLIANCEFNQGSVMHAWPQGAPSGGDLSTCCQEALRQLSGEHSVKSQADWKAWARTADKKRLLSRTVAFGDP